MTQPQNISSIEAVTGRKWQEWQEWLAERQAEKRSHPEIARLVQAELDGVVESAGWWAQGITVAYEQQIGRRQPGQRSDGSFEVGVSKAVALKREELFRVWRTTLEKETEINRHRVDAFRTSITPVRSYLRFNLDDKSSVSFAIEAKNATTTLLVVTHSKLLTKAAADAWRVYWKDYIGDGSPG